MSATKSKSTTIKNTIDNGGKLSLGMMGILLAIWKYTNTREYKTARLYKSF